MSSPCGLFSLTHIPIFFHSKSQLKYQVLWLSQTSLSKIGPFCLLWHSFIAFTAMTVFILLFIYFGFCECSTLACDLCSGTVSLFHPGTETGMGKALNKCGFEWMPSLSFCAVAARTRRRTALLRCHESERCCLLLQSIWALPCTMHIHWIMHHWWCHFIKKVKQWQTGQITKDYRRNMEFFLLQYSCY